MMSDGMLDVLATEIQALDLDSPFTVTVFDENVWRLTFPDGVYAPSVFHDEETDVRIDDVAGWEALTGFTGQQGYNGAVNHASEFVGREIARELVRLAEDGPQTYVMCVVYVFVDGEMSDTADAAGWAILRRVEV